MFFKSRFYFAILCMVLFANFVKSQPVLGIQAGINLSALGGHKIYSENKDRFGLSAYGSMDFSLGRNSFLSIETGLAISQQGMNHSRSYDSLSFKNTLNVKNRLDYIYVPIYLKENLSNFYTKIGPYAGYLFNAKSKHHLTQTQTYKTLSDTTYIDTKFPESVKNFDLGISLGFGYIHYFEPSVRRFRGRGRTKLTPVVQIDFRYNIGLININASDKYPDMKFRNRVFTVGVTITSVRN